MDPFNTIEGGATGEYEEKKSRFIAALHHADTEAEALAFLARIREENPMARHNVYAYILREDNRVRYSDDGEPQKTAGIPVLSVLEHAGLKDVICVVTRYFGGTLLGTGGLVRAYTKATQEAVAAARLVTYAPCRDLVVCIGYPLYDQVSHFLSEQGVQVLTSDFAADVTLELRARTEEAEALESALVNLTNGAADILVGDESFQPIAVS
ncbi:MAG: YigZ family protein [Coriobacteriia bacterium]|nr:YigZ family protein [Coriobacteriia bacterium]